MDIRGNWHPSGQEVSFLPYTPGSVILTSKYPLSTLEIISILSQIFP